MAVLRHLARYDDRMVGHIDMLYTDATKLRTPYEGVEDELREVVEPLIALL